MTTAREIMHTGARCVGEDESLRRAAEMMRDLGVGSLPICGNDDRLRGMIYAYPTFHRTIEAALAALDV